MTDAEKILVFISEFVDVNLCKIYCAALKENGKPLSEAQDQWTVGTIVKEILETYK